MSGGEGQRCGPVHRPDAPGGRRRGGKRIWPRPIAPAPIKHLCEHHPAGTTKCQALQPQVTPRRLAKLSLSDALRACTNLASKRWGAAKVFQSGCNRCFEHEAREARHVQAAPASARVCGAVGVARGSNSLLSLWHIRSTIGSSKCPRALLRSRPNALLTALRVPYQHGHELSSFWNLTMGKFSFDLSNRLLLV